MSVVGAYITWPWIKNLNDNMYSATWSFDMPPTAVYAKVFPGQVGIGGDPASICVGLVNIRKRLPNNSDQEIDFPEIDSFTSAQMAFFDPRMTHVTFGAMLWNAATYVMFEMLYWE